MVFYCPWSGILTRSHKDVADGWQLMIWDKLFEGAVGINKQLLAYDSCRNQHSSPVSQWPHLQILSSYLLPLNRCCCREKQCLGLRRASRWPLTFLNWIPFLQKKPLFALRHQEPPKSRAMSGDRGHDKPKKPEGTELNKAQRHRAEQQQPHHEK